MPGVDEFLVVTVARKQLKAYETSSKEAFGASEMNTNQVPVNYGDLQSLAAPHPHQDRLFERRLTLTQDERQLSCMQGFFIDTFFEVDLKNLIF